MGDTDGARPAASETSALAAGAAAAAGVASASAPLSAVYRTGGRCMGVPSGRVMSWNAAETVTVGAPTASRRSHTAVLAPGPASPGGAAAAASSMSRYRTSSRLNAAR